MRWLTAFNQFIILYYLYSAAHYLLMMAASLWSTIQHQRRLRTMSLPRIYASPFTPPVTLLVPAYNEQANIVETVRSLLALTYPELEVIVINDGSADETLARLEQAFKLVRTQCVTAPKLETRTVRGFYVSLTESRLLVLDKENGGKSDALNAGLNFASSPYVCAVDADAVLESDALLRVALPLLLDPDRVAAVGGIVRVVNGSRVTRGRVEEVHLPRSTVEAIQVVEYLRGFLFGREGWSALNGLLIISGAFGCFSRQLLLDMGGYLGDTLTEDMELVVRMHRHLYASHRRKSYRIMFIPDPVCWTEVPADLRTLARQRKRWQKGLLQVLWKHRSTMLNPRYGLIGLVAFPYQVVVELLGPVVELLGWISIVTSAFLGILTLSNFVYFLILAYLIGTMISIGAVLLEELNYRRYQKVSELARLLLLCVLEFFPYRQFLVFWRVVGMLELLVGKRAWGTHRRRGFAPAASSSGS